MAGAGTASPTLRLVNVDSENHELIITKPKITPPLLGDKLALSTPGTAYHAISDSGETVFFTATLAGQ